MISEFVFRVKLASIDRKINEIERTAALLMRSQAEPALIEEARNILRRVEAKRDVLLFKARQKGWKSEGRYHGPYR